MTSYGPNGVGMDGGPGRSDRPTDRNSSRNNNNRGRGGGRNRRERSWSRSRSRSRSPPLQGRDGRYRSRERSYSPSPPSGSRRRVDDERDRYGYDRRQPPPRNYYPPRAPPVPPHVPPYFPPPPHLGPPFPPPHLRLDRHGYPPHPPPPHMMFPPPGGPGGGRRERRRDEGPVGVSLLIRNVSPDVTNQDLQVAFGRIGEIRDVYIPRDFHSQQPKGFAFIEYANAAMAADAREEMNRFVMKGRELEVVFAQERRKTPNEMRGRVVNQQNYQGGEGASSDRKERSSSYERSRQKSKSEQKDQDKDKNSKSEDGRKGANSDRPSTRSGNV